MKLPFSLKAIDRKQAIRAALPVLALALIASVVTGREKPSEPAAAAAAQPSARIDARVSAKAAAEQELDLTPMFRQVEEAKVDPANNPFARRSFGAPGQQAQPAAAPAAPPSAPALPFRYVGKALEDGKLSVFLMRGDDSFSVSGKQKLDEQYRIDKVTETSVAFTYLPLNTRQVLDIPVAQ
jgi:hypothetical protein